MLQRRVVSEREVLRGFINTSTEMLEVWDVPLKAL